MPHVSYPHMMKTFLVALVLTLTASVRAETPSSKAVTEQEAVQIARDQLAFARPSLEIEGRVPYSGFVPVGPESGGGPKWVIGFSTTDRKSSEQKIYYVTIFPDGRTSKDEVRAGASS